MSLDTKAGLETHGLYIGGEERLAASGDTFESVNPTTGAPVARYAKAGDVDVDRAVTVAQEAFKEWRTVSATRRGRLLARWADSIAREASALAQLETSENGKLLKENRGQLDSVPSWLYYYGGLADKIEGRVIPLERADVLNYTLHEPLGVVAAIKPWNSPALITMFTTAPALAAGNVVIIKPSEFTPGSALALARLADEAGLPKGVVNVVTGDGGAGGALAAHQGVAKLAFTGGSETGRLVAQQAGHRLLRTGLELGGKSANIVFADANLDAAGAGVLGGIFAAGGQSCVAGSRLLIEADIFDDFLARLVERAERIELGDPLEPTTEMGPLANRQQLAKVEQFVNEAREGGADIVTGGARGHVPDFPEGLFYRPTIVRGVTNSSRVAQEEIFGPVLTVIPFAEEDEAVRLANSSRYGLVGGVWTHDASRAHRVARALEVGTVWINTYRAVTFNSPQAGYKESGIGRKNGKEAIFDYLQTKSVWHELRDELQDPFAFRTSAAVRGEQV